MKRRSESNWRLPASFYTASFRVGFNNFFKSAPEGPAGKFPHETFYARIWGVKYAQSPSTTFVLENDPRITPEILYPN